MATLADHPFSFSALSPFSTSGLCPLVLGHKEGGEPEAILPKIALLPLSHPATLQPPISDEMPPMRSPITPPTSHPALAPHPSPSLTPMPTRSTPLGTQASTASQPLQPRQCTPGDTALITQWLASTLADRGARASPRSARVRARPGRRERHWRSETCTRPFLSRRTPLCMAASVQRSARLALHA
jgi:hypothetical protein